MVKRPDRGQTLAEAALVLPIVMILLLGAVQCALLAYGSAVVRFSAFCALRASAVAPPLSRQSVAQSSVYGVLAKVPAVSPVSVMVRETPLRLGGAGLVTGRMTCTVTARVPRILPLSIMRTGVVRASCAMPMEPTR